MRSRDLRRVDRFKAAVQFMDTNQTLFAAAPQGYQVQAQKLRDALRQLEQSGVKQRVKIPEQTLEQRRALRAVLRDKYLMPLRQVSKVLARTNPGMSSLVDVPRPTAHIGRLLQAAQTTANALASYAQAFIDCGFPEDFLAQLRGASQAVEAVSGANTIAVHGRRSAGGDWKTAMLHARDALCCLDVVVRRVCDTNPTKADGALAAWNSIVPPVRRGDQRINALVNGGVGNSVAGGTAGPADAGGGDGADQA